ncbi:MAG: ABC transporter permease [Candidatus Gallimonas sp.]
MKLLALMKKEFVRFFSDPKLLINMLLPGILIYIIYSLMGNLIWQDAKEYKFVVAQTNAPEQIVAMTTAAVSGNGWSIEFQSGAQDAKERVEKGELTAYVVFPENFEEKIGEYDAESGTPAPQVELYYRSADEESMSFFTLFTAVLDGYEHGKSNKFDVNAGGEKYDFSEETNVFATTMGRMLPFIVVALVFSSCMGVTLESVAGEKERGTLATVLVTSVRRSHVALGKVVPLSCVAAIGALSSFLGVVLSLPKLAGMAVGDLVASYGFTSYLLLFLLIMSVIPLIVAAIAALSTYAKSVKEASAYTSIVMIVAMVLSIAASVVQSIGSWTVVVPILNAVVAMQGILTLNISVWQSLVSVGLNLVYAVLLVLLIAKMLSSERIMFGK